MISKLHTNMRRNFSSASYKKLQTVIANSLSQMKSAGTFKNERVITSSQAVQIMANNSKVLNFCANNYLGLSNDEQVTCIVLMPFTFIVQVIKAASDTLKSHGFGMSSVRFICGTMDIHKELEQKITNLHKTQDTILFPSCFDANAGFFETILTNQDAIISDALNHASIIDGIRLSKAQRFRYKHSDMKDLEEKLKEAKDKSRVMFIVTDGVFSMDGDIAHLPQIVELAKKYDASIFVDQCHGTGVFGENGGGTPQLFGLEHEIDAVNSTIGKASIALGGGTGGYTTGRKQIIQILRQKARPYLFSNSIAPPIVGASIRVFDILANNKAYLKKLQSNTTRFRTGMKKAGFNILGHDSCPIAPVLLQDARLASEFADEMMKKGIYVIGFSFPVVPKGQARIRVQLSAAHSQEQIDHAIHSFQQIGREKGVVK